MKERIEETPQLTGLEQLKTEFEMKIAARDVEISMLQEQVRSLKHYLFGNKSEKLHADVASKQPSLFELEEAEVPEEEKEPEEPEKKDVTKPKKPRGRKRLPEWLPREQVIHDLPQEEKVCKCGCQKTQFGEDKSEVLERIPAKCYVVEHIRLKYACQNPDCEVAMVGQGTISIAPPPARMIPKSLAGHSLLAQILTSKFVDWLPFYRVEKQLRRENVGIPRQSMCRWAVKVAELMEPMWSLLLKDAKDYPYLQIDETTLQVMREPDRKNTSKSYMWVIRGGPPDRPIVIYKYHPTRAGQVAKDLLEGFKGIVQTDGYEGYSFLDHPKSDYVHAGCLVHVRRKFAAIVKAAGKKRKKGYADKVLVMFKALYKIESDITDAGFGALKRLEIRQEQSKLIMEDLHKLLLEIHDKVPPRSMLGSATSYALKQWPKLLIFLENGMIKLDTNDVENAIRPFVVGRKGWMFAGHPKGAEASAILYSMVETALCRARHRAVYADRRTMPNAPDGRLRKRPLPGLFGDGRFGNIRHSLGVIGQSGNQANGR